MPQTNDTHSDQGDFRRRQQDLQAVEAALGDLSSAGNSDPSHDGVLDEIDSIQRVLELIERIRLDDGLETSRPVGNQSTRIDATTARDDPIASALSRAGSPIDAIQRVGRFDILSQLGQGGYGLVFLAHDRELDRNVALKVPRPEAIITDELRARFLREGKTAGLLSHPNIVAVFEAGRAGAVCYIVSRYVDGVTLAEWMSARSSLCASDTAAALVATLADAVQHAHSKGVIHRDLKPTNVILEGIDTNAAPPDTDSLQKSVRITDFGLAKTIHDQNLLTGTGAIIGTPSYMSPEQALGTKETAGAATDVYSLGAILYELLTGRPPFVADSVLETLRQVRETEPAPLRRLNTNVARDLEAICLKCLDKEPANRYSTASDLHADLTRYLSGEPVRARPISKGQRLRKWCRRNPETSTLVAMLLLSGLSALMGLTAMWLRSEYHRGVAEQRGHVLAEEVNAKQAALKLAQMKSRQLTNSIRELFSVVAVNREIKTPEAAPLRRRVIAQAEAVYDSVMEEAAADDAMKLEHAKSIYQVALLCNELGEPRRAQGKIVEAIRIAESLDSKKAKIVGSDLQQTLGSWWVRLGHIHTRLGDFQASENAFALGIEYLKEHSEAWVSEKGDASANASTRADCAHALALTALNAIQAKNVERALDFSEQAECQWRALRNELPDDQLGDKSRFQMGHSLLILGQVYDVYGDLSKSESLLYEAIEINSGIDPFALSDQVGARTTMARTYHCWGITIARQDRLEEARIAYHEAISQLKALVQEFPYSATAREYLASAQYSLAFTEHLSNNFDRAEQLMLDNIEIHREMSHRFADSAYISWDRIGDNYGVLSEIQKERPDANVDRRIEYLRQAAAAYETSLSMKPAWREPITGLARAQTKLARLLIERNELVPAERYVADTISQLQQVGSGDAGWEEPRNCLVDALFTYATIHAARRQWTDAIEKCRRAIEVNPNSPAGELLLEMAKYLARNGQLGESEQKVRDYIRARATQPEELVAAAIAAYEIAEDIKGDPREPHFRKLAVETIWIGQGGWIGAVRAL